MKLIILDRDGVINEDSDAYIKSPEEFHPIPGSLEAIARLNGAGYHVVVATNQSGIARGLFDRNTLEAIHGKLHRLLEQSGGRLEGIYYCPHGPDDRCDCRKPKPGLLLSIERDFGSPLREAIVVGDSLRDLESARSVGARPVLVLTGKGERTRKKNEGLEGVAVHASLADFVEALLSKNGSEVK